MSTFVIVIVLALGSIMLFSSLTINLAGEYEVENIPEFEAYNEMYNDFNTNYTKEIIDSNNYVDGDGKPSLWSRIIPDSLENAWQDSIVRQAFSTIKLMPKTMKFATKSVSTSLGQAGLHIPSAMKFIIYTIVAFTTVFLFVQTLWEKKVK